MANTWTLRFITAATLLAHLKDEAISATLARTGVEVQGTGAEAQTGRNLRDARHEFEKDFILRTLKENEWNVSRTAQVLGIERSHLHRKIKSYGIEA